MNQKTITGSTDSNGLFTAKNPYDLANPPISFDPKEELKLMNLQRVNHGRFNSDHPPLFCYNENNELVKGVEGLEVKGPVFQMRLWGLDVYTGWKEISQIAYLGINPRGKDQTRAIYIAVQPTEKAEKQSTGERELYYCLSDNGDLNGLYLASMREVSEHIEMDLGDIEPSDLEKVQYTITPVYLTQTEFDNLPEYEG